MFAIALLAASLLAAATTQPSVSPPESPAGTHDDAATVAGRPGAPPAPLAPGAPAPDFTYQSHDYRWLSLHHMLSQGSVLLVFGATDDDLMALECERDALLQAGVVPVAVVCRRERDVWRTVHRCRLTYSLLADPNATIAGLFGSASAGPGAASPGWFLIEPSGRVRGAGRGLPAASGWCAAATEALGLTGLATTSTR